MRLGANADDDAASRPLSYGVSPKQAALKDQAFRPSVNLCGAESSRVRVRGAPKTDLLASAGRRFANFVFAIFRFGANDRWSSGVGGANADDDAASRPLSYGVSPKQAALKDQAFRPSVNLCGAESSRVRVRGAPKTDLLAPAGRRFANFVFAIFRFGAAAAGRALDDHTDPLAPAAGRRRRTLMMMRPAGRSATGYRQNRRH